MIPTKIKAPALADISNIELMPFKNYTLDNGIEVCEVLSGEQEVIKAELILPAGKWNENKRCVANFTSRLLKEGTTNISGEDIAEKIDFYGASIKVNFSSDYSSITIFCLNKYFEALLMLTSDMLNNAIFPEHEVLLDRKMILQKYEVNKERIEYIAQKELLKNIFGPDHPYGYFENEEDITTVTREDVIQFYEQNYIADGAYLFISGKAPRHSRALINKYLGQEFRRVSSQNNTRHAITSSDNYTVFDKKKDASQAAIRIGKPIINKNHEDYRKLGILNMILGGYFGSRLMSNIREEKGYTYGIYSTLHSYFHGGIFYIGSEVGSAVCTDAVKEIYFEIERLRNDLVPKEELELVKNYLRGNILSSIDGPFNTASVLKGLILYGRTTKNFYDYIDIINSINSQDLLEIAQKYLDTTTMYEVISGSK